jgi:hypothetical protein
MEAHTVSEMKVTGMCRLVWQKFTNISEVLAASMIRVMSHCFENGGSKHL